MLTATERIALIEKIKNLPAAVEAAANGLSDEQLNTPYRVGGWTVRQVIHHLADSHLNAFTRMKLILTEEQPTLKPYDQDKWAALSDTMKMPIVASLTILDGLHQRWGVLMESIPESAWTRSATHPERGSVSLEDMLKTYALHGEKHVQHIMSLRLAKGW